MNNASELGKLLETAAKDCKREIPNVELSADKELLDDTAGHLMRVVFHLERGMKIPTISIFGPGISIVQEKLETAGYEANFSDYLVYKEVAFFGDIYPLAGELLFAILSRVQLSESKNEFVSLALFSEHFNPKRFRL